MRDMGSERGRGGLLVVQVEENPRMRGRWGPFIVGNELFIRLFEVVLDSL